MIVLDNVPSAALVLAVGVLFAVGVYLLLERSLTRVLLGFVLVGNGANLALLIAGGRAGTAPIVGNADPAIALSDPLAQAMVLTSIVITLALTAFVLAMAYRSWQLNGHDEVQDDDEDRRIARRAARNEAAYADFDAAETGETLDEEAAEIHDDIEEGFAPADPADAPGVAPHDPRDGDAR
ncbi:Na(+)/H(+) antiporter subunit C [Xylanimonas allomyrinae]|uniref:Na(+)/H(+) antiporter subunit C n=1 Tax=Xylanimonas allomyrinae TaxID=2509459 RepID=A0A4P6ETW0_9MICO|nr:Na(+)/H(+) antiporter subunit C [Xylanimonas allomyrinae]QAY63837.1 Na(+)/H(+) antiporter subunit C [Xylanimonas allomyrinae]